MNYETIHDRLVETVEWIRAEEEYGQLYCVLFLALWITFMLPSSIGKQIFRGLILATIGKLLGNSVTYLIGRFLLRQRIQSFLFKRYPIVKTFGKAIAEEGFRIILAIRLSPAPQFLKCYGLSVLDVPYLKFSAAGLFAGIPGSIIWSLVGVGSHSLPDILNGKISVWSVLPDDTMKIAAFAVPFYGCVIYLMYSLNRTFKRLVKEEKEEAARNGEKVPSEPESTLNYHKIFGTMLIIGFVIYMFKFQERFDLKSTMNTAVDWIRDQGEMGPVYYTIFLAIWVILLLPCTILEVVPGFLFGFKVGTIISIIGKSVGSYISLVLGRYFLRDRMKEYVLKKYPTLNAFSKAVELEGFKVILMIRVAYLPMLIKNYGLAVLDIPIYQIVYASILAGIPFSALWAFIGASSHSLGEIMEGKKSIRDALPSENTELIIGLGILGVASFSYVLTKFGMRFRQILAEVEVAEKAKQE